MNMPPKEPMQALGPAAESTLICGSELFRRPPNVQTRWITFESPRGEKGRGGMSNRGAKGHACEPFAAGETKTLCHLTGAGVLRRIWMTLSDRSPIVLRGLRLEMYWDGQDKPAVSCPLGDFFGIAHGQVVPHWNALFSSPEGRSFNCTIPMPFRTGCRVVLVNESTRDISMLFYEVDLEQVAELNPSDLYFHAHWRRERPTVLGRDFTILPAVQGQGRFLGCNVGVIADPIYGDGWWGEGEVKVYLDGDDAWPTLVGTGAEDYIGTGWGLGVYFHPYQGCSVADRPGRRWAFYRYHIPDPVYFDAACRVTIQSMGGMKKSDALAAIDRGAQLTPATVNGKLMMDHPELSLRDPSFGPDAWCNHYRCDDYCATAYFYFDRPVSDLPPLPPTSDRIAGIADVVKQDRADL